MQIHMYMYVYVYIYIYVCVMCIYIYIYIYITYIHTYIPRLSWSAPWSPPSGGAEASALRRTI